MNARSFTYAQLLHEVKRIAAALRGLGIGKGDRLTIYMPPCPEAIALMLATVRIGAIHSVVFAGFGARALADRIQASGSRLVFTADVTYRKGKHVRLKEIVRRRRSKSGGAPDSPVVTRRRAAARPTSRRRCAPGRDLTMGRLSWTRRQVMTATAARMEANEPAYILATSGTTAKPKLAIHTHGGYQVHICSMGRWCFGLKPADVWWATSDIGWIVGHSYMVYAPLITGCTTVVFEGALDHPHAEANWRVVVEELGVDRHLHVADGDPDADEIRRRTAARASITRASSASSARVKCSTRQRGTGCRTPSSDGRVPVIDHMWQTETGGPVFGNPFGIGMLPIKPGSATIPLPGIEAAVVTAEGRALRAGRKGHHGVQAAVSRLDCRAVGRAGALRPRLLGEDSRRATAQATRRTSTRTAMSGLPAASDEIIKIAGHRIGTIEVESAFLMHPSVAECGVVGRPDETRGEVISAFVLLKHGYAPSPELREALLRTVRREMGPVAVIGELNFVTMLPKTRSGKIMRRVLKAVTLDRDPGDITTIEDEGSVDEARQAWRQMMGRDTQRIQRIQRTRRTLRIQRTPGESV